MTDLNQTLTDDSRNDDSSIDTGDLEEETNRSPSFTCEKCERIFSKKRARDLHLRSHNIKAINYTPGIVKQKSRKQVETRLSIKMHHVHLYL